MMEPKHPALVVVVPASVRQSVMSCVLDDDVVAVGVDTPHLDTGGRVERLGCPTEEGVDHHLLAVESPGPLVDAHSMPYDVLGQRFE